MDLTPKELDVLTLVACGYVDKEIAEKLKVSYRTVNTHLTKILLKLNARTRAHAAVIYLIDNPVSFKRRLSKVK